MSIKRKTSSLKVFFKLDFEGEPLADERGLEDES